MSRRNLFFLPLLALAGMMAPPALAAPGDTVVIEDQEHFEIGEIEQAGILYSAHLNDVYKFHFDGEAIGCGDLPPLRWYEAKVYGYIDNGGNAHLIELCYEVTLSCKGARWVRSKTVVDNSYCEQ